MPSDFRLLQRLYDTDRFGDLVREPDGIYWLKLRSITRTEHMLEFCREAGISCEGVSSRQLFAHVYDTRPNEDVIDKFIRRKYLVESAARRANEDYLISQLYQMSTFDWGGLFQNSLEQTIVNNYVKQIQSWDRLNQAIERELHQSMRGYVQCSWYNHWTSIIIEDIFSSHPAVLPAIGLIKKVDLFVHNFPFDLKVTYLPEGYMAKLRRRRGLRPEFTELKAFCRGTGIWFDQSQPEGPLFAELLRKVSEHPSQDARNFIAGFRTTRASLVKQAIEDPTDLKVWLYENQGIRRFDAGNRLFLILVDSTSLEDSWKLKRNKALLVKSIHSHLNSMRPDAMENLRLSFEWGGTTFETYADILFVLVSEPPA